MLQGIVSVAQRGPAEPLPLGVSDARDLGQGGKYFAKSLKLISLGKELDLADLYT